MLPDQTEFDSKTIRITIVEDDIQFLDTLCIAIKEAEGMYASGIATTRSEGLALLREIPSDVLVVDLGLPDGSGIDVIQKAARVWPTCNIMVSTVFGDEMHVMRSIEAGAAGYLLKDSTPSKLVSEIRNLANGGSPISPIIARQILTRFRRLSPGAQQQKEEDSPSLLSPREREVLELVTKGFTANEIAKLIQVSHFTVRSFVRRIYSKLNVTSKAEAIYEARNLGLLPD
jgi:DNA-binding NarL/FixJ family response regulator